MHLTRRNLLHFAAGTALAQRASAGSLPLPVAESLPDALQQALATGNPLLVMVSLDGCPFCKAARESYLSPLHERNGLPVVQVNMHSKQVLKNFQGNMQTHEEWIRAMQVRVAPTVLFFGRAGVEIAQRMTGGYIPDFYGAYLDDRIRQAKTALAS